MKLRPIEASFQVANRIAIKTERHEYHPSVEMRSPSSLKASERNAPPTRINRFARLRVA